MTSEVVVMNMQAVALATDSAVTVDFVNQEEGASRKKIFISANKLFTLSKYQPVGVMVYGEADLMGVPWETIIKLYRATLGRKSFHSLQEYVSSFIDFIQEQPSLFSEAEQESFFLGHAAMFYSYVLRDAKEKLNDVLASRDDEGLTEAEIAQAMSDAVNEHFQDWESRDSASGADTDWIEDTVQKYDEKLRDLIQLVFEDLPLSDSARIQLVKIGVNLMAKDWFPERYSGIVVAGFGEGDLYPRLQSFDVHGVVNCRLKYRMRSTHAISSEQQASIEAFAQQEMVYTFMEGVDPAQQAYMEIYLKEIFDKYPEVIVEALGFSDEDKRNTILKELQKSRKKLFEDWQKEMNSFRNARHVRPVVDIIAVLPKDELATMAETLVNLTSFKRRVTPEAETVGGEVDVAVISKGDGFIWIKRKHYFKAELNHSFFQRYFAEGHHDEKAEEQD